MEDSRNIIKAIDALTLKAGGEVVDSKNITEAIDKLRAVYDESAIGIDKTLTHEGLAADAKAVRDLVNAKLFFNKLALSNVTSSVVEYLDSISAGCVHICHTYAALSDMPSDLATPYSFVFITNAINRRYDVIYLSSSMNFWIGSPTNGTLGNRTIHWLAVK